MDFLEDLGGCALFAVIAVIILLLIVCVAVVFLGVAIPTFFG
jgi:hypothetical protein